MTKQVPYSFLQGGGEMAELIQKFDWSKTSIGPLDSWPQSLRTTLNIVLTSKFPMFFYWSEDLICFYNDAFRPSLGDNGKHPGALGSTGPELWEEIWPTISPMIRSIRAGEASIWKEDLLLPYYRNSQVEEVYWTFSYSPVWSESGKIEGVLAVCYETTEKRKPINQLKESDQRFQNLVREATVGIIVLSGKEMRVEIVNEMYGRLIGRTPEQLLNQRLFDIIPETESVFRPIIDSVRTSGQPMYLYDMPYSIDLNGDKKEGWLNLVYQPYKEADGRISGVMVLCQDVTEAVQARKKVDESEQQLRSVVGNAPFPIGVYIGREMRIQLANQNIIDVWGKGQDVIGKLYSEILPELGNQEIFNQLDGVFTTGQAFHARNQRVDLVIDGKLQPFYFNYSFTPLFDTHGEIYGVMNTAADVTDLNRALNLASKNQKRFRAAIDAVQGILWTTNSIGEMEIEQPGWAALTGQSYQEYQGFGWAAAVHPDDKESTLNAWKKAVGSQEIFVYEHRLRMNSGEWGLFSIRAIPLVDTEGAVTEWVGVHTNITAQREAEKAVKESDLFVRSIIENSPVAKVVFVGKDMNISIVNERMLSLLGRDTSIIGKNFMDAVPELQNTPLLERLRKVLETGETFYQPEEKIDLIRFGKSYSGYYNYTYKALPDTTGHYYGVIVTATEVTDLVKARKTVEETEVALRGAVELAALGTWNYDLSTQLLTYSDRLNYWFGLENEPHSVEEVFNSVLPDHREQIREAMKQAIASGTNGLYNVEYTIINQKTGKKRILQAQGKAFLNADGTVYKIGGVAQDVTEQRRVQSELESMVQERTEELQSLNEELSATNEELAETNTQLVQSNRELEEFSYAASHDMQEPLRKIQTFSSFLLDSYTGQLDERGRSFLDKIGASVVRMKTIIDDLLRYSHQTRDHQVAEPIDLNTILRNIQGDLELLIQQKKATINVLELATIEAVPTQMHQLFYNLITNALKFSRPNTPPVVTVRREPLSADDKKQLAVDDEANYIKIVFSDNGIGFRQEYATQIFSLFKRLHAKTEYEGTGIGLGLCKKIVQNHRGLIYAQSEPGKGADFHVVLPIAAIEANN